MPSGIIISVSGGKMIRRAKTSPYSFSAVLLCLYLPLWYLLHPPHSLLLLHPPRSLLLLLLPLEPPKLPRAGKMSIGRGRGLSHWLPQSVSCCRGSLVAPEVIEREAVSWRGIGGSSLGRGGASGQGRHSLRLSAQRDLLFLTRHRSQSCRASFPSWHRASKLSLGGGCGQGYAGVKNGCG